MSDSLGDRMKGFYENRTRSYLTRRTYTIIRVDGKAFHTYTRKLKRPFDDGFVEDMNETAKFLCKEIQGAKFAFVQSDEISVLLTDFDDLQTDLWFDGNIQKMCSVAASLATSKFNQLRVKRYFNETSITLKEEDIDNFKMAQFDARVFQISSSIEVENYFIWRQQDASRNSISAVAQSLYSHKSLEGVSSERKQDLIFQKGINWNNFPSRVKRGGFITKVPKYIGGVDPVNDSLDVNIITRYPWDVVECPVFTQDREFLNSRIPKHELVNN
jgi:tRNA(His) guanylyltransferase